MSGNVKEFALQSAALELSLSIGAMAHCSPSSRDELYKRLMAFALAVSRLPQPDETRKETREALEFAVIVYRSLLARNPDNQDSLALTNEIAKIERLLQ